MSGKSGTSQVPLAPLSSSSSTHKTAGQSSYSSTAYSESISSGGSLLLRIDDLGSSDQGHRHHGDPVHRAQRRRNTGGFLLRSPSVPPVVSHNAANLPVPQGSEDIKGKSRIERDDLAIPKRRKTRQLPLKRAAVGSSPLSIELFNAAPARADDGQPRTSDSIHIPSDASRAPDARHLTDQDEPRSGATSGLGDPAQIVNLALNLSESRRRTFSASRISPMGLGNRRIPSLNQHNTLPANTSTGTVASGGSLRQYMQPQRQSSRDVSPRSNKRRDRDISFPPSPWKPDSRTPQILASEFDIDVVDEVSLKFSDATLARAEKARVALELCYEYRRLLDYLPAIPRPRRNKSALSRPPTIRSTEPIHVLGREYNPLQYIRNRRVRGRERKMLDAEGDGWKDLERVRNWVDTVAREGEAKALSPTALYSLPPFETSPAGSSSKVALSDSTKLNSVGPPINKPRRTKLDWSVTAWDLLADAYWLCQGENWKNIEYPNGSKIVLSKDTHLEGPPRTSPESARSSRRRSKSVTGQHMTPEKSISPLTISRNGSRERGRQHMREPNTPVSNDNGSHDRRRRWARGFVRSHSLSSSNGSVDGGGLRDSDVFARDHPDNAILEKQMRELLKKEAEAQKLTLVKRDSLEENQATSASVVNTENSAGSGVDHLEGLRHIRSHSQQVPELVRPTPHEKRGRNFRYSLDEPFSTSSNNSSAFDFEPGRASDSSPLGSRSVNSSRRPQDEESQSINGEGVRSQSKENTITALRDLTRAKTHDMPYRERIANFGNGLLSPMTAEALGRKFKRADALSPQPARDAVDTDSRFRSFFKGAKTAGFAGNEVHKTDSKMQKKENQCDSPHHPSPVDDALEGYDTEADMSELESSPEDGVPQTLTKNDELTSISHKATATATDRTKLHVNHLSSFRSPHKKTVHDSVLSKGSSNADHITRQQMAQRAQGRSSRFDRLAPPKIDIERISPTASISLTHIQTRDTDISHDESRRSSDSQSDTRLREMDKGLQGVLGRPGTIANRPPVSLLSGLESGQHRLSEHGNIQGDRQWSVSDKGLSPVRGDVSKREIARARALLLSSGVKANEIVRRAQEVRESPSDLLRELQTRSTRPLPKVPRSQEHIIAARVLISNIETSNRQLKEATENFSSDAVKILGKIEVLRNHVSEKLTPAVGAAADDADIFSSEITIAHTLAVKQLHDSVNILLRRRRRKFRWVRRGGYVMLEWAIMCIMWCVWFVVVFIRAARGIIWAIINGVRWFFWM